MIDHDSDPDHLGPLMRLVIGRMFTLPNNYPPNTCLHATCLLLIIEHVTLTLIALDGLYVSTTVRDQVLYHGY